MCSSQKEGDKNTLQPSSSNVPRSSWPNTRYLFPPTNGLIAKKYRFKSEPKLEVQPPTPSSGSGASGHGERDPLSIRATLSGCQQDSKVTPPTIVQWGDGSLEDDEEAEMMGISGVSSAGSSNISCNFLTEGSASRNHNSCNSRKTSSVSGTGSKRSSIFSAFKNPWSYLTGFITKPDQLQPQGSSMTGGNGRLSRGDISNYCNRESHVGESTQKDNYLLKPIAYFGGEANSQRLKFSSVPDLWAVRGSPELDVNHHKKHSINSDTGTCGVHTINPSSSHELAVEDPNPVLKLIVTSQESVYL